MESFMSFQYLMAASLYTVPNRPCRTLPHIRLPIYISRSTEEHITQTDRHSLGLEVVVQRRLT
jgi:hypothetical protein